MFAIVIAFTVFVIAKHFWMKGKKPYAAAVVLVATSIGLLLVPSWTLATLIIGAIVYAASFVGTTRATIATTLLVFGAFCALLLSFY